MSRKIRRHAGKPVAEPPSLLSRRRFIGSTSAALLLLVSRSGQAAQTSVLAVRVWPAKDYTRITLESREPLVFTHQSVRNPERLVVDLEGVELNEVLQSLPTKITGQDPYIQLIRAGRNRPGVVRLVIELKAEVSPQRLNHLIWALLFSALALFAKFPGLDLLISARYYDPELGFFHRHQPVVIALYDWTPWIGRALVIALALYALLAPLLARYFDQQRQHSLAQRARGSWRHLATVAEVCGLLGPCRL